MKTAIVTGASRGLGLALARALAERDWKLVIDARGEEALTAVQDELARTTAVVAIPGDVADEAHRRALVAAVGGGLDLLVNNASVLGPSPQPQLADYPLDVLEHVYRVNVAAPLALVQLALPVLRPGARILNVTSDAAVEPYEGWGGYGSSKAALEQLTNVLAAEHPVGARAAQERVVTPAAEQRVPADAAGEEIVRGTADQRIIARAAVKARGPSESPEARQREDIVPAPSNDPDRLRVG